MKRGHKMPLTLEVTTKQQQRVLDALNLISIDKNFGRFSQCLMMLQLIGLTVTIERNEDGQSVVTGVVKMRDQSTGGSTALNSSFRLF